MTYVMDELPEFNLRISNDPFKNRELERGFRRLFMRYPELCHKAYEVCHRFEVMNRDVPSLLTEPCRKGMQELCLAVSTFNGDETAASTAYKVVAPMLAFRPRWDRELRKTVWERIDPRTAPGAKLKW